MAAAEGLAEAASAEAAARSAAASDHAVDTRWCGAQTWPATRTTAADPTAAAAATATAATATAAAAASTLRPLPPWPLRSAAAYQSCFCEENVWLLARDLQAHPSLNGIAELFVVFVSNHSKMVPLWRQRAAASADTPVVWDYHVFLVARLGGGHPALVFDLDCTLDPFPCTLEQYRRGALIGSSGSSLPPQYRRCYRVVPAPLFLAHFASDRSHMRDAAGGWLQSPPPWPPIVGAAAAAGTAAAAAAGSGVVGDGGTVSTLPAYLSFPPQDQLIEPGEGAATPAMQAGRGRTWSGTRRGTDEEQRQGQPAWLGVVMTEPAFLATFALC